MLETLRLEDFLPLVGTMLPVEWNGSRAELEVAEAAALHTPSPRATPSFRVTLRSRTGWRAEQGMFRLHHPSLGALDVFAVPVGPDGQGLCYEIVFN